MRRRGLLLALIGSVAVGCLLPNPAFDSPESGGAIETASQGGASVSTSVSTSDASAAAASDVTTSAGDDTTAALTTLVTTSSSGEGSSTGMDGCGGDEDCAIGVCSQGVCLSNKSCKDLKAGDLSLPSGEYPLDPDADGPLPPLLAHCDMSTSGGGWTLVARINGTDAQSLLYDVWTAGATVGDILDFDLATGGDALYPSHTAVTADELLFFDATAPCGDDNRLAQTPAILGEKTLHRFLAELPPLAIQYNVGDPDPGPNVASAVFMNEGCIHPFHGTGSDFSLHKLGINVSMTAQDPNAFMRFAAAPHDFDKGIASKDPPDGGYYDCGDLDALADGYDGWPGHVVTVFVR